MAAKKRSNRATKRTTRSSKGSSLTPVLVLGGIVAFGAFSLWASANHKSPQAAFNSLWKQSKTLTSSLTSVRPEAPASKPQTFAPMTRPVEEKKVAAQTATKQDNPPPPRPSVPVRAVEQKPEPKTLLAMIAPQQRPQEAIKPPVSSTAAKPPLNAPRGKNTPDHSPSTIYAKDRLTIRKTAWDRSAAIGTVEKGREMRSYGKTGRWHRVVVPSTNMIGWVHEDQLIGGKQKRDTASIITGSVVKTAKPAEKNMEKRIQPPLAVGKAN